MSEFLKIEEVSSNRCFEGDQKVFDHQSSACNGKMRFGLYVPDKAYQGPVPLLVFLSGLTCTHENFVTKAGSQALASEYGVMVLAPDTSPRGQGISGEDDSYDFGSGAGFYLNATREPWNKAYQMQNYLLEELLPAVLENFKVDHSKIGITGHSMGGHGALTLGLKNPARFQSISAFAPIVNPMECPWGQKAFSNYLGEDKETWKSYDACELILSGHRNGKLLVDQGTADQFLEKELLSENLIKACEAQDVELELNFREGHDHSYYFISTYLRNHFEWHGEQWQNS